MRHMRPHCSACIYWVVDPAAGASSSGHCHRYPPLAFANPATGTIVQKYPTTDHQQWCGEWSGDDAPLLAAARLCIARNT